MRSVRGPSEMPLAGGRHPPPQFEALVFSSQSSPILLACPGEQPSDPAQATRAAQVTGSSPAPGQGIELISTGPAGRAEVPLVHKKTGSSSVQRPPVAPAGPPDTGRYQGLGGQHCAGQLHVPGAEEPPWGPQLLSPAVSVHTVDKGQHGA